MHAQGHVARRYAISLQEMASEKCSHWRTPARGGVGGQCVKGACNSRTGERESREVGRYDIIKKEEKLFLDWRGMYGEIYNGTGCRNYKQSLYLI